VVSGFFALAGLAAIIFGVGRGVRSEGPEPAGEGDLGQLDTELAALAAQDGHAEELLGEAALSA
jgi:hypothetical protein